MQRESRNKTSYVFSDGFFGVKRRYNLVPVTQKSISDKRKALFTHLYRNTRRKKTTKKTHPHTQQFDRLQLFVVCLRFLHEGR